jgi:hypothetical protein
MEVVWLGITNENWLGMRMALFESSGHLGRAIKSFCNCDQALDK